MTDAEIRTAAETWMAEDPDPATREAVRALLEEGDPATLREHFGARLEFGTAGIRGPLGPGPNRMNRALVRKVSAGLAETVLATGPDAAERGIVIGYDGRHGSRAFAEDAAAVCATRGLRVWLHDAVVPTPQLAHDVTFLGAAAGVMVTASHNPPADNGYKVYWGNGAQIVPPIDTEISRAIDRLSGPVEAPPLAELGGRVQAVPEASLTAYLEEVAALRVRRATGLRIVYSAMHGVGADLVERVLADAGHTDFHAVPEQRDPDPDFPTVAFPNPEEAGALDLALALAAEVEADVILAHDPDADRLAVAVRHEGDWVNLSGNQTGVLLADDLLTHGSQAGPRMVATSLVSSTMLSRIAAHHGAAYGETLTGFKWIANLAIEHEAGGGRFVMGYEEALGYSIGSVVRDKDGVSAALVLADLAAACKAEGRTLIDQLESLYRRHGFHGTRQESLVMPGVEGATRIAAILDRLRQDPPRTLAGRPLVRVRDLLLGEIRDVRAGEARPTSLPKSNVLDFQFGDDVRILARPSGTEPKIKFYFEVRAPVPPERSLVEVREEVEGQIDALAEALLGMAHEVG